MVQAVVVVLLPIQLLVRVHQVKVLLVVTVMPQIMVLAVAVVLERLVAKVQLRGVVLEV